MAFVTAVCTDQIFEQMQLPASLKESKSLNPIGRNLIHDVVACSALVPHPFHHSDYPDRDLSFYLRGQHFAARELVTGADSPDQVVVPIGDGVDDAMRHEVSRLLEGAVAVLRADSPCSVQIVLQRKQAPPVRMPRPPEVFIPKLNKFCDDTSKIAFIPNIEELTIQTVIDTVLLPEEAESLKQHLQLFGWGELSPVTRDIVVKVFDRLHQR